MRDKHMNRLLMGGMLVAMQCQAVTYEWPYLTSVDVLQTASTQVRYTLHMAKTRVVDDSIGEEDTVYDVLAAKGKKTYTTVWIWGGYHKIYRDSWHEWRVVNEDAVSGWATEKWVDAAKELSSKWGSGTMTIYQDGSPVGSDCVGTGMWTASTSSNWDEFVSSELWNGGVTGACLGTPPLGQWCALKTPTVEIAYGTLTLKDADGSTKNAGVQVECTTGMKYTLRLQDANNETPLDNGGRVTWQAGGKAMGETLTGEAGENGVDLTATLHGPFERTGEFHGSGILFVSYP